MSRPRFLADNDLDDAIVLGVLSREPAIEFKRLRDLGLETFCRDNEKDKLPGRLQGRCVLKSRDAGPVNFIGWFGSDTLNVPVSAF